MCGIVGIYSPKKGVQSKLYYGLNTLQHRGQESCGIVVEDTKTKNVIRKAGMGLVNQFFKESTLNELNGNIGIGHVRYSTTGQSNERNIQPLVAYLKDNSSIAIAHNGNLVNHEEIKNKLIDEGYAFQTTIDSEVILALIVKYMKNENIADAIKKTMSVIRGGYAVIVLLNHKLIVFRDPHGIRPLTMGKGEDGELLFASENGAIEVMGGKFIRDIEPGEILIIDKDNIEKTKFESDKKEAFCAFEYIYFTRTDATLNGLNVYKFRNNAGRILYEEHPTEADLVVPIPDSGVCAAISYAQASGIKYSEGLVKNRYIGRSFIKPTQEEREMAVRLKLSPLENIIKGKKIILVDDSIVRGTTSKNLITRIRQAGAKEIHMRIACPEVKYPDFYGIDMPTMSELISNEMSKEEVCKYIGADSLEFLSIDGLNKAAEHLNGKLNLAYFNGEYPEDPYLKEEIKL